MKTKKDELIHVRVEYNEAVEAKKDILSLEIELLRIVKIIKRYHNLRNEELENKTKFLKKIRDLENNFRKLQTTLPKLHIPETLKKEDSSEEEIEETKRKIVKEIKEQKNDEDIEFQLREIREKLASLQK